MAKIAGITIELGADASGIEKALKGVDKSLKTTQSNLKDINKLLKLDPGNTTLLAQKQKELQNAVKLTKDRLSELKEAQSHVAEGSAEWDALQREIIATEQNLKKAETELKNFGSVAAQKCKAAGESMKQLGSKVEDVGKKLSVISGAAAGALGALGKLGYDAMQSADELDTLSKQTGVSTDELQKWSYASDLVDVSTESMTGALKKLKKGMDGDAKAISALGVDVKNADGSFRDVTDVFYDTLAALSQIDNETERDIAAMAVFGKGADDLAGIIDDGGAALKEYGQQAEDLGLIMSGDTLDALNDANDTIDELKANVTGSLAQAGATLATTFAPVLEKVATLIGQVTERIRALTPAQAETIVKVLAVVAAIGPVVLIIGKIISGVGTLMTIIPLLAGPLGIVIAVIAAAIAIGVLLYKNWDKIKAAAAQVGAALVSAWESAKAGVTSAVEGVKTVVTTVWEGIKTVISKVVDGIKGKIQNLIDKFNAMKTAVKAAIDFIKNLFSTTTLSFPKIKLPHFRITGGEVPWGIGGKGTAPKIDIDWYRKAYQNPVMFTSPTVLPTMAGMKGFGDGSGAEIVMGLDKLREVVGSQNVNVTVVLQGDARQLFKVVRQENNVRTKATNYNALAVGG